MIKNKKILLSFIFSLLGIFTILSQNSQYTIKVYGFEEGISHRNTFSINQDSLGYIWIATINGLNRFDGKKFTPFSKNEKKNFIPSEFVGHISINKNKSFYLYSPKQLIDFNPYNFLFKKISLDTTSTLSDQPFMIEPYFSIKDIDVVKSINKKSNTTVLQQVNNGMDRLEDLMIFKGKTLEKRIQDGSFLYYYHAKTNSIRKTLLSGITKQKIKMPDQELKPNRFDSPIIKIIKGRIYVLFQNGNFYSKSSEENTFKLHPLSKFLGKGSYYDILLDGSDIWISGLGVMGKYDTLVKKWTDFNQRIRRSTIYNPIYRQIFKDQLGIIWVATNYGAVKLVKKQTLFSNYLNEKNEFCTNGICSTRGITGDKNGNIYISYYNSIHVLNENKNSIAPLFPNLSFFNPPYDLCYSNEALWTGNGLKIDLKTHVIDTIFGNTKTDAGVTLLKGDEVWMGFKKSIHIYNTKTKIKYELELNPIFKDNPNTEITFLEKSDNKNEIWVGTDKLGVLKINTNIDVITYLNTANLLPHNRILCLKNTPNILWIGTAEGLVSYDKGNQTSTFFNSKNGLPNSFINGILIENDSTIWASTDKGISRINHALNKISNFFIGDGLVSNEFNRISFYKDNKTGKMYFGGLNGLNVFHPKNITKTIDTNKSIPFLFTHISKYNSKLDSNFVIKSLSTVLNFREKSINFEYSLLDFERTTPISYTTKLEGFDNEWTKPSTNSQVKFRNLPPEDYILKVRYILPNKQVSNEELSFSFTVEEAIYKQSWFQWLILLIAISGIFVFYKLRLAQLNKRRIELKKQVEQRTKDLKIEKNKTEKLLLNILPEGIATELKIHGSVKARKFKNASILFCDIVGFTKLSSDLEPENLVQMIDEIYSEFDKIVEDHQIEKIKTIGDAYMCASGLKNTPVEKMEARNCVLAAKEMLAFLQSYQFNQKYISIKLQARIGINTGKVVAGIVGTKKFAYDIWGDSVNIAARLQGSCEPNKINISKSTFQILKNSFEFEYRGKLKVKNKGEIDMYYVK